LEGIQQKVAVGLGRKGRSLEGKKKIKIPDHFEQKGGESQSVKGATARS